MECRNLFPYLVSGMPRVVSAKKGFGVGSCKVVASNLPHRKLSILIQLHNNNRHNLKAKKVYLEPTLQSTYIKTAIKLVTNCKK